MRVFLASFADSRYGNYLEAMRKGAVRSGFFDQIELYCEKDLDTDFLVKNGDFIRNHRRGYGYWIWKPQVCLQTFRKMQPDDILVYADAGCTINYRGKDKFDEYIATTQKEGAIAFQFHHLERTWTKGDLFQHLNTWEFADTGQYHATFFFLKKNETNQIFLETWLQTAEQYHLLTDHRSVHPNLPGFIEHRHDQSIFSLLQKKRGVKGSSDSHDHKNWPFKYETMLDLPIWITQLVGRSLDTPTGRALKEHDLYFFSQ